MEPQVGSGMVWRLEKKAWKQIGSDDGVGYEYDELLKQGGSKSVLKCLGIDPI